jgi:osmoprotectant transport system ATP-binding protein
VTKRYGQVLALDDFSLQVEAGEFCVLVGPSGCGKTTCLRLINRLLDPDEGCIRIDGVDIASLRPEHLRRQIGYVIQSVGLFPHMTVAENIGVVPRLLHWPPDRIRARVDELLHLVSLEPSRYRDAYPRQLSGGEAQRVGVARALAADPAILLMDEPFGAVDPITRDSLHSEFARLQKALRKTVVFVTHFIDEAIRLGDRVAVMREGRLVQHDTPEELLAAPANDFVRDFIGSDRALKRLLRFQVGTLMRPARSVAATLPTSDLLPLLGGDAGAWVLDEAGRVVGWVDAGAAAGQGPVSAAMTRTALADITISAEASLNQALSMMVGLGVSSLPVTGPEGKLLGEVRLEDIAGLPPAGGRPQ